MTPKQLLKFKNELYNKTSRAKPVGKKLIDYKGDQIYVPWFQVKVDGHDFIYTDTTFEHDLRGFLENLNISIVDFTNAERMVRNAE